MPVQHIANTRAAAQASESTRDHMVRHQMRSYTHTRVRGVMDPSTAPTLASRYTSVMKISDMNRGTGGRPCRGMPGRPEDSPQQIASWIISCQVKCQQLKMCSLVRRNNPSRNSLPMGKRLLKPSGILHRQHRTYLSQRTKRRRLGSLRLYIPELHLQYPMALGLMTMSLTVITFPCPTMEDRKEELDLSVDEIGHTSSECPQDTTEYHVRSPMVEGLAIT
jgi:hypothetical protein